MAAFEAEKWEEAAKDIVEAQDTVQVHMCVMHAVSLTLREDTVLLRRGNPVQRYSVTCPE